MAPQLSKILLLVFFALSDQLCAVRGQCDSELDALAQCMVDYDVDTDACIGCHWDGVYNGMTCDDLTDALCSTINECSCGSCSDETISLDRCLYSSCEFSGCSGWSAPTPTAPAPTRPSGPAPAPASPSQPAPAPSTPAIPGSSPASGAVAAASLGYGAAAGAAIALMSLL
jgi:hypothetical protein